VILGQGKFIVTPVGKAITEDVEPVTEGAETEEETGAKTDEQYK